jgi:hypothetical protein
LKGFNRFSLNYARSGACPRTLSALAPSRPLRTDCRGNQTPPLTDPWLPADERRLRLDTTFRGLVNRGEKAVKTWIHHAKKAKASLCL